MKWQPIPVNTVNVFIKGQRIYKRSTYLLTVNVRKRRPPKATTSVMLVTVTETPVK